MNKHTPGPWYAVEYAGYHIIKTQPFYDAGSDLLNEDETGCAKYNAQLAASAPELLQALQRLIACRYDSEKSIFEALEYAEQVIKPFQS